jgi:hypothetical protein
MSRRRTLDRNQRSHANAPSVPLAVGEGVAFVRERGHGGGDLGEGGVQVAAGD